MKRAAKWPPFSGTLAGSIRDLDPTEPQPPPLQEVLLDARNVAVSTRGYPICAGGGRDLRARGIEEVRKACRDSIVGTGSVTVSVKFPDLDAIPAKSPLLVFNGGTSGGTTTFYIYAYLTQPITTAVVATVKIKKVGSGIKAVATIPKIANGAGSVTDFSLKIDKKYTYEGEGRSVLSAKCVGGKIQADVTAKFYDGQRLSAGVPRTCTSKP